MDERIRSYGSDQPETRELGSVEDLPSLSATSSASEGGHWRPRQLIFSQYAPKLESSDKAPNLRVVVRRPVSD